jgi:hypothetical protein
MRVDSCVGFNCGYLTLVKTKFFDASLYFLKIYLADWLFLFLFYNSHRIELNLNVET